MQMGAKGNELKCYHAILISTNPKVRILFALLQSILYSFCMQSYPSTNLMVPLMMQSKSSHNFLTRSHTHLHDASIGCTLSDCSCGYFNIGNRLRHNYPQYGSWLMRCTNRRDNSTNTPDTISIHSFQHPLSPSPKPTRAWSILCPCITCANCPEIVTNVSATGGAWNAPNIGTKWPTLSAPKLITMAFQVHL